jgi:hypothetical protein
MSTFGLSAAKALKDIEQLDTTSAATEARANGLSFIL